LGDRKAGEELMKVNGPGLSNEALHAPHRVTERSQVLAWAALVVLIAVGRRCQDVLRTRYAITCSARHGNRRIAGAAFSLQQLQPAPARHDPGAGRREGLGDYFAAIGNKGQYVFVFPRQRLVIVRHGIERGAVDWTAVISGIALTLDGP